MKKISYFFIVMLSLFMMTMTSCVNELEGNKDNLPSNVASLQDQVTAMKSSVLELESIYTKLNEVAGFEEYVALFEDCATSVKEHVALVENGLSGAYATVAAMKLQGQIADAAGTVNVALAVAGNDDFQKDLVSLEKSVSAWLGKDFKNYFGVLAESARLRLMIKAVDAQTIAVEALASDVEAGLRVGDASSLEPTLASVNKSSATLSSLNEKFSSLSVEIEEEYTGAIKAESSVSKSTLKAVNTKAVSLLADAVPTLDELASRIAVCETEIAGLKERLTQVEAGIDELLGMIQSVTFLSEYSEEKAIAYYTLSENDDPDYSGKKLRARKGSIELNYLVRPASVVTALADMNTWDENGVDVKIQAYYAEQIATKSFNNEFFDMEISAVETNAETGLLKLTVSDAAIDKSFYMRETGTKVALSLKAGKTDVASKFVEIIPKDESNTVYLESFSLASSTVTLKTGTTSKIEPIFVPADATVLGFTHDFNDPQTMVIGEDGTVEGRKTGTYTITLTTKGVNEWGQNLTAKCTVKIEPNIQIISPGSVEVGSTAEFTIDAPEDVKLTMQNITWRMKDKATDKSQIDYNSYAGISKTSDYIATITGFSNSLDTESKTYSDVYVICEIDGTKYESTLKVLHKQPRAIIIKDAEGNNWNENSLTLKLNETSDILESSRLSLGPDGVDASMFRINTVVEKDGAAVAAINANNNHILTGSSFIGGENGIVGNATIRITVTSDNGALFIGSPTRYIYLKVEPVYVTGLQLTMAGETITGQNVEVNAGSTTKAIVVYNTDKDGLEPSYKNVVWKSSDETVATVDEDGNITVSENAGGKTCTITVTTDSDYSVPEGESQKSASFTLVATSPWKAFEIGDYVYADSNGEIQFASAADVAADASLKSKIVGIVFAKQNPRITDTRLPETCAHGLAVGVNEPADGSYYDYKWFSSVYTVPNSVSNWAANNGGYESLVGYDYPGSVTDNGKLLLGYNNTLAIEAFAQAHTSITVPIVSVALKKMRSTYTLPNDASLWYIPSIAECALIYNASIAASMFTDVGGMALRNNDYWTSSENGYTASAAMQYNLYTGSLQTATQKSKESFSYVRPIFAF